MAKNTKAPEKPPTNGLKRLEDQFSQNAQPTSFPAYVRENFTRFHKILTSIGRRGDKWDVIAKWARDEGLVPEGTDLKPDTARRAYERVRKEKTQIPSQDQAGVSANPGRKIGVSSNPVRMIVEDPAPQKAPESKDAMDNLADDLSSSLNAGRGWLPKDNKRR